MKTGGNQKKLHMNIFNDLVMYIGIGILVNLIADLMISSIGAEEYRLTNYERTIICLIWPIAVVYVIVGLINPKK